MNHRMRQVARMIGIALTLSAGAVAAQGVVNGPYYATPSWDQTLPAANRFLILANFNSQAVLDRETGLVWQRAVNPAQYDSVAARLCVEARTGGRFGWRLPSTTEVTTLFDPSVQAIPSLPAGHPFTGFDTTRTFLWVSSREPSSVRNTPDRTYIENFIAEGQLFLRVSTIENGSNALAPFLCVRGSPGGDFN